MNTEQAEERGGIVAYRASAKLIAEIEAQAAAEGRAATLRGGQ